MQLELYRNCRLCPRVCGVDRPAGLTGYCRETSACRIASIGPHHGEEPSFSGTRGSGTIFFSGCSSRCFFCQNYQISLENQGEPKSLAELVAAAEALIARGVHNLNFVTPDHFWPHVAALCAELRAQGATLPFLFNCSGYELAELVPAYAQHIDIFMPDFKFALPELAHACMRDGRYPALALAALRAMVRHKGFLEPWDPTGATPARRGVLVRHLVLPGQVANSLEVIRVLHREFGSGLPLSVMSQFRPMPGCREWGMLTSPVAAPDYERVCELVAELGFEHAYIQPALGDRDFLPDFSQRDPFPGNRRAGE